MGTFIVSGRVHWNWRTNTDRKAPRSSLGLPPTKLTHTHGIIYTANSWFYSSIHKYLLLLSPWSPCSLSIYFCVMSQCLLSLSFSLYIFNLDGRVGMVNFECIYMCGEGGTSFVCVTNSLSHSEQSTKLNHIYSLIYAGLFRCVMMLMCSVCVCMLAKSVLLSILMIRQRWSIDVDNSLTLFSLSLMALRCVCSRSMQISNISQTLCSQDAAGDGCNIATRWCVCVCTGSNRLETHREKGGAGRGWWWCAFSQGTGWLDSLALYVIILSLSLSLFSLMPSVCI